jgi:hypothetical protein
MQAVVIAGAAQVVRVVPIKVTVVSFALSLEPFTFPNTPIHHKLHVTGQLFILVRLQASYAGQRGGTDSVA